MHSLNTYNHNNLSLDEFDLRKNNYKSSLVQVDVITIVKNGAASISETLFSVSCQTYDCINHIIIDGNSTDKTIEIIKNFDHNKSVNILFQQGTGIANAFNNGIDNSQGDLVIFLNSGDIFVDCNIVQKIVDSYITNHWLWAFGETISVSKHRFLKRHIRQYSHWRQELFLYNNPICHQSTIFSQDLIQKVGLYNEHLSLGMDYDFNIRASLISKPYLLYFPISYYDTTGVSSIKVFKAYDKHLQLRKKYFPLPKINDLITDITCFLKTCICLVMIPVKWLL
jgi:glycosyltransferase involved in cell wall biosynthesis